MTKMFHEQYIIVNIIKTNLGIYLLPYFDVNKGKRYITKCINHYKSVRVQVHAYFGFVSAVRIIFRDLSSFFVDFKSPGLVFLTKLTINYT